jgi:hypothetical protein
MKREGVRDVSWQLQRQGLLCECAATATHLCYDLSAMPSILFALPRTLVPYVCATTLGGICLLRWPPPPPLYAHACMVVTQFPGTHARGTPLLNKASSDSQLGGSFAPANSSRSHPSPRAEGTLLPPFSPLRPLQVAVTAVLQVAVGVVALPAPEVPAHVVQVARRLPPQLRLGLGTHEQISRSEITED